MIGSGSAHGQTTLPPQVYAADIYRDELGIGHVWGAYDPDVAYGVGRLIARDRPLRTYVALTVATGRSAEVFGELEIPTGKVDYWLKIDRLALACEVPQRAQALWDLYCNNNDPDSVKIRNLIVAYVEGIKDEILTRGAEPFASVYDNLVLRGDWPYGETLKNLTHAQRKRLFERATDVNNHIIQQWEPFAAILFWLGQVSTVLGRPTESAMDTPEDLLDRFFGFGSSSWGILDAANGQENCGFLQADSHNGFAMAHMVRFASRFDTLDCGGAVWEGLGPFLLNGAFTRNAGWGTMFHTCDNRDTLKFEARETGGVFQYMDYYRSSSGVWTTLTPTTLTLKYYDYSLSTLVTTNKTIYCLDDTTASPSTMKIWAGWPDNDTWVSSPPTEIRAERLATLDPGIPGNDPALDQPRTLYKMLTAPDAEAVADLLLQAPLGVPLNYTIGSGTAGTLASTQQLISVSAGRVPFRMNEYVDNSPVSTLDWSRDYRKDIDLTDAKYYEHRWRKETVGSNDRMFHPPAHFPRADAHDPPAPQDPVIKYMANCNSGLHWIFGRMFSFPDTGTGIYTSLELMGSVEPRYEVPLNSPSPYQKNPIVHNLGEYWTYVRRRPEFGGLPPAVTLAYFDGNPPMSYVYGKLTMRQEWAINRLSTLYESKTPHSISEDDLMLLINDRTDWTAHYLHKIQFAYPPTSFNWFETARTYLDTLNLPEEQQVLALMTDFNTWATPSTNAPLNNANLAEQSLIPVKWVIFWDKFRNEGALTTLGYDNCLYREPFYPYWPDVNNPASLPDGAINDVRTALINAAVYTVDNTSGISPTFRLEHMFRIRTPFVDGAEYGVTAYHYSKKRVSFKTGDWEVHPTHPSHTPKREVYLHSFLPILVRFPRQLLTEKKVWLMNYNIVSDQLNIPDWGNSTYMQRYKNSIKRAAEGTLTTLRLTEAKLMNMTPAPYHEFVFNTWTRRPGKK